VDGLAKQVLITSPITLSPNLFQDVLAEVRLAARFSRVDVEEAKASFRVHEQEMTSSAKISAWCEDSLELLDTMCALVPTDGVEIRREGRAFLAGINYSFAVR
jgi:hypothetical protein